MMNEKKWNGSCLGYQDGATCIQTNSHKDLVSIIKTVKYFAFSVFQCTAFDIRKSSGLRLFVMITTILLIYAMAQVNVVRLQKYY